MSKFVNHKLEKLIVDWTNNIIVCPLGNQEKYRVISFHVNIDPVQYVES